jgi:hypothetical protein
LLVVACLLMPFTQPKDSFDVTQIKMKQTDSLLACSYEVARRTWAIQMRIKGKARKNLRRREFTSQTSKILRLSGKSHGNGGGRPTEMGNIW